jgi:hypothetical protein
MMIWIPYAHPKVQGLLGSHPKRRLATCWSMARMHVHVEPVVSKVATQKRVTRKAKEYEKKIKMAPKKTHTKKSKAPAVKKPKK